MNDGVLEWHTRVSPEQIAAVDALLDRVSDADGVSALSEHSYLHLRGGGGGGAVHGLVVHGGDVVGYAFLSEEDEPLAEFLVDPAARREGLGGRMLAEILATGGSGVRIWAHGLLPGASALAASAGMVAVRRVCRYTRALEDLPDLPLPDGVVVRAFAPADSAAWLELNAAAFVDLPDQGSWTAEDLADRLAQPWFDAAGFLLAFDEQGLVGCHWTKVHGGGAHEHERTGEVYVLAVAPRAHGRGLGPALTVLGLRHLQGQGLDSVLLYVDAENTAAVR
ncbi:MAG TPA: mycothiol synthase, partial [Actinomycetota bacterium]|nr:mycothiol synthase [Actinomycetota bacterium]